MRDARQDHALEVGEDCVERFAVLGSRRWERPCDIAGPDLREHGETFGAGKIVGDPVREAVGLGPEALRVHVAEPRRVGRHRGRWVVA